MARTATTPEASAAGIPPGWEFARMQCGGIYVRPPTFGSGTIVHMTGRRELVMLWSLADAMLKKAGVNAVLPLGLTEELDEVLVSTEGLASCGSE